MSARAGEPPAGELERRRAQDLRLAYRYRRLLVAITLPLFIVVLVLAAGQYRGQRAEVIRGEVDRSVAYVVSIEGLTRLAHDHVTRMRFWWEAYSFPVSRPPRPLREYFLPRAAGPGHDGYTLDAVPPGLRQATGQILWVDNLPPQNERDAAVLDHLIDFFGVMRLTHAVTDYFQWSYFFPADQNFISIFPWVASDALVEGMGHAAMPEGLRSWFEYEIYLAGTPAHNPDRQLYWTAPYLDAAGAGAMVSLGAPVYIADRFVGIVGTDVRLDTLEAFIGDLPRDVGRLWVLDGTDTVLADSAGTPRDTIRKLAELSVIRDTSAALADARRNPGVPISREGYTFVARKADFAPWTLLYTVSDDEISALLLPRFVPYGVILILLAATFFAALLLLRREFINPALSLVRYIQRVSRDPFAAEPRLPLLWQPWVTVVSRTFVAYREASRKMQESEAFKSAIVENAMLAVVTVDEAGSVVEFNAAAEKVFGCSRDFMLGKPVVDLLVPEPYREAHRKGMTQALARDGTALGGRSLVLSASRADGTVFPVELALSMMKVGERRYFTAFVADLTERKEAEDALRASEEQYRAIFNAVSDALALWNAHGQIVDSNLAHEQLTGYSLAESRTMKAEAFVHPSSVADLQTFRACLARGETFVGEATLVHKSGELRQAEISSVPMVYQGRRHSLTIARDITALKRAGQELARQREALRQSEKMSAMGALLAGVAHELNNPLAILMGRAALLEDKATDRAVASDARKIHAAAERCGRIVRTFLAMARQRPSQRRMASLNDIVSGALDLLAYSLRTSAIDARALLAPDLPEVEMDPDQVGQVAINLLVNAQQALAQHEGMRHIRVETGRGPAAVFLRVADNGPGVTPDLRARIFDPFFTTKAEGSGIGVGLSVSRSIAREHGGELILEESGEGASFVFTLPSLHCELASDGACGEATTPEPATGHALIVDDEPEVGELLAEILESAGFSTTRVHGGQEALEWLENGRCDFVVSDIGMPGIDGPALWRALRSTHPLLARRMAFVTGDTLSASVMPFLRETGLPWLEKPFTVEEVLSLVARIESA